MNPFNQFWKKYIDDDSADINIAKRKQEISRWLLIYALVVLALRGIVFIAFGHGDQPFIFWGEFILIRFFHLGSALQILVYGLPFFMWGYSVKSSSPEQLLIWYFIIERVSLILSFLLLEKLLVMKGLLFLLSLFISKKLKCLEKRRSIEETTSIAEAKSEPTKRDLLRTEANAMLFAYGVAALYPRLMGSFMRVGIWDFVFSGMPRSWWNIALYSSIPFVVCLYSVKTKKADKLVLGYSLWLVFEAHIAFVFSVLYFFTDIFDLIGGMVPMVVPLGLGFGNAVFNGFLYFFVCNMTKKYRESSSIQSRLPEIAKRIYNQKHYFLIIGMFLMFLYLIQSDLFFFIIIILVVNFIAYKIFRRFRVPEYAEDGVNPTSITTNDLIVASDEDEQDAIKQVHITRIILFLIVISHMLYALESYFRKYN